MSDSKMLKVIEIQNKFAVTCYVPVTGALQTEQGTTQWMRYYHLLSQMTTVTKGPDPQKNSV